MRTAGKLNGSVLWLLFCLCCNTTERRWEGVGGLLQLKLDFVSYHSLVSFIFMRVSEDINNNQKNEE